jgi:hypothetical protein
MKNFPSKQRISALSTLLFVALPLSCRHRQQNQASEAQGNDSGLDVNDVSFLYPPMGGLFPKPDSERQFGREAGSGYMEWLKESVCKNAPSWSDPQECEASTRPYQNESKRIIEAAQNLGLWPSASEFISEPLFQQILGVSQGKGSIASFGIDFRIKHLVFGKDEITKKNYGNPEEVDRKALKKGSSEPLYENYEFDFSSFPNWRVVSARYAPCPFQHVGPSVQNEEEVKGCTPEVRLVIQPFTDLTQASMALGGWLPISEVNNISVRTNLNIRPKGVGGFAGDYAMHLFFRLNTEESSSASEKLLSLKNEFQAECPTTGVPLFVHPCFRSALQNLGSQKPNVFPKKLLDFLKENTKNLHKVAVLGSRRNSTPWFFYQGQINKQGQFDVKGIKTIDPSRGFDKPGSDVDLTKNNSNSLARNGLRQGKVLMVRRSASLGTRTTSDYDVPAKDSELQEVRLVPMPKVNLTNLDVFLRTPVDFQTNDEFHRTISLLGLDALNAEQSEKFKSRVFDHRIQFLLENTSLIENPVHSHEFNVDCASCHLSNTEGANARRGLKNLDKYVNWKAGQSEIDGELKMFLHLRERKNLYVPAAGITGYTFPAAVYHQEGPNRESYIFNQFSIYGREPRVSQRVVNESAEAAAFVNSKILKKQNPAPVVRSHFEMRECVSGTRVVQSERGRHLGEELDTDWFQTWMVAQKLASKCLK